MSYVHSGRQDEECLHDALAWIADRADWSGSQLLSHLREQVAPRLLVEKSPENSGRQSSLRRLLAVPGIRVIHLVRHPVTVAESLARTWSPPSGWRMPPEFRHQFAVALWYHHHRRVETVAARLGPARAIRVRAEDVVNSPGSTLPALCAWLGVDGRPESLAAMTHPENWAFASVGPPEAPGGGDPHFLTAPALRPVDVPSQVQFPAPWRIDPWTRLAVGEMARRYGYG